MSPVTMLRNPGLDGTKAQDQVIRKKLWRPVQTKLEPLRRNHHRQRWGEIEILSTFFFPLGSKENINMTGKNIFL